MSDLKVNVAERNGALVLQLFGRLDAGSRGIFEWEWQAQQKRSPSTLVIHLAGLQFMDSSGLGELVRAREDLTEAGWTVAVQGAARQPLAVIHELRAADKLGLVARR